MEIKKNRIVATPRSKYHKYLFGGSSGSSSGGSISIDTNNFVKKTGEATQTIEGDIIVNGNIISTGEISAYGAGTGSTGGGTSYNRLDNWVDYGVDKAGYVLSAYLGSDLNSRLIAVENNNTTTISFANITGKPTTLSGYGIIDAATSSHTHNYLTTLKVGTTSYNVASNLITIPAYPTTLPASDVYAWAKASTKPSYTFSEIGSNPTTLSGYGITDALNTSSTAQTKSGNLNIGGSLSVTGDIAGVRQQINTVKNNLGTPTVEEMALFYGQFNNKFRFIKPILQEQSTDNITWVTSTRATTDQLGDMVIGEGQGTSFSAMPSNTVGSQDYYRLTWDATQTGYIFLNHLYVYCSTNGNNINFKVEAYHNTNGWGEICNGTINNLPGHVSIRHTSIPFSTSASQYGKIRIVFSRLSASNTNVFSIYGIEWFGGYPAGRRNAEYYDRNKNVTFPANVTASSFIGNASSATKLASTRTIWGQNFDGTENITGDLTLSGNLNLNTSANQINTTSAVELALNYAGGGARHTSIFNGQGGFIMRAHANGNVGIGILEPQYKLDVAGTFRVNYNYSTTFTGNDINFTRTDGSSYINAGQTLSLGAGGTSGVLNLTNTNVATFKELLLADGARIYSAAGAGLGISLFNEPSFNPNYGLMFAQTVYKGKHGAVNGDWATYFTMSPDAGRGWIFTNSASSSSGNVASISNTGNLTCSGEVTAYSASDIRLKTNIKPIMSAIDVINKLNPVTYNWNEKAKELNPLKDDSTEYGLIAQELEEVLPELVHPIYDGEYKSIDYVKIVPLLIGAIKELQLEINKLKNK